MTVTIVIADDHDIVHDGLAQMFVDTNLEVVGNANDGRKAIDLVKSLRPDLCLLDVRMPKLGGLDALDRIKQNNPDTRVVMISTFENPTYVARAILRGACDYITKGASRAEILSVLSRAYLKQEPPETSIFVKFQRLMSRRTDKNATTFKLTNREVQVLRHLGLGLSNLEISRSLQISIETVKEHVQNILRKMHGSDRTQVAVWAVREELI